MKKVFTFLVPIAIGILLTATLWAQSPEKMSYQAIIRDNSNNLVTNTSIGMQISILQGSASGTSVFVERHFPTTNINGLVSIEIGSGTVVSGNFSTIDWANDSYFIKTETDLNGGANYTITGTSQLLSVPYALHAKNTDSWLINGTTSYSMNRIAIGTDNNIGAGTSFCSLKVLGEDNTSAVNQSRVLITRVDPTGGGPCIEFAKAKGTSIASPLSITSGTTLGNIGFTGFDGVDFPDASALIDAKSTEDWTSTSRGSALQFHTTDNGSDSRGIRMIITPEGSVVLKPLDVAPSNPVKGEMYFDNVLNKLRVYDGTTWQNCW